MTTAESKQVLLAHTPVESLERMRAVSNHFYFQAVRTGNHAFIEFTGLMNEYIKLCSEALDRGDDFTMMNVHTGEALEMQTYHAVYLGEKFGCIFYTSLAQRPELMQAFLAAMLGCQNCKIHIEPIGERE